MGGDALQANELTSTKPRKKRKSLKKRKEKMKEKKVNLGGRPRKKKAEINEQSFFILTKRRIDAGFYTVTDLAKRLGITRQMQSQRENKRLGVSADWIVATAEALSICPYELGHDLLDEHIAIELRARRKKQAEDSE